VALASGLQSAKARDVAGAVARRGARLVLVGGPVGSGTRPVAEALELELGLQGLRSTVVNLADFYATDADSDSIMPLVANRFVPGRVVACLSELLGGAAEFTAPTGKKIRRRGQIVVLEGAFALAESVLHAVTRTLGENDVFRVFAEPLAHVRLDDHTLVTSRITRLLRTVAKESGEYGVPAETVLEAFLTVSVRPQSPSLVLRCHFDRARDRDPEPSPRSPSLPPSLPSLSLPRPSTKQASSPPRPARTPSSTRACRTSCTCSSLSSNATSASSSPA